jgi:hypothetical protein
LKIKQAIAKAAEESIGYKKLKNRKWHRMWNYEMKLAVEEKKASYRRYLQTNHWSTLLNTKNNEHY